MVCVPFAPPSGAVFLVHDSAQQILLKQNITLLKTAIPIYNRQKYSKRIKMARFYNIALLCCAFLPGIRTASAEPMHNRIQFSVGVENYRETYREYRHGTQRIMQQRGKLWSVSAGMAYPFNRYHSANLNARYAQGKSDYTGGITANHETPATPYSSVSYHNTPRKAYHIQAAYQYRYPIGEKTSLLLETGLGYRVLKDLPRKQNEHDYDRQNQAVYARAAAGLHIKLPRSLELTPLAAYHHVLHSRQHSYNNRFNVTLKQKNGKGFEATLPLSKRFSDQSALSIGPFYRGWKVFDSDTGHIRNGNQTLSVIEPKNYTHEAGLRLEYHF